MEGARPVTGAGRPVRYAAAALALVAGLIHVWVAPEHFEEAPGAAAGGDGFRADTARLVTS